MNIMQINAIKLFELNYHPTAIYLKVQGVTEDKSFLWKIQRYFYYVLIYWIISTRILFQELIV